jgi:hypothetical protein
MGQWKSKLNPLDHSHHTDVTGLKHDPDEKWSNLYREREKNHLYKWVGMRTGEEQGSEKGNSSGGDLIAAYERDGDEGVLRFAAEKMVPMMYEDGQKPQLIKYADYVKWKKTVVGEWRGKKRREHWAIAERATGQGGRGDRSRRTKSIPRTRRPMEIEQAGRRR